MPGLTPKSTIVVCIIAAFLFQIVGVPNTAEAKYRDQSGNLPNDGSSTATTVLLVAAAGCVVVATVLMIKHHKDKSKQTENDSDQAPAADSTATAPQSSLFGGRSSLKPVYTSCWESSTPETDLFISPYLSITPAKYSISGEKMVVAGVVVGF